MLHLHCAKGRTEYPHSLSISSINVHFAIATKAFAVLNQGHTVVHTGVMLGRQNAISSSAQDEC